MANRNHQSNPTIARDNIGGAVITRSFTLPADAPDDLRQPGNRDRARVGRFMAAALVRSLRNRRALEDGGFIKIAAAVPGAGEDAAPYKARIVQLEAELKRALEGGGERYRYAFHTGMGKYDVIDGLRLNTAPLTKDEAAELAKGFEPPKQ